MSKDEVVAALEEIGTLMELKGETGFRARAYLGAARALAEQSEEPAALVKAKRLGTVRGVGSSLAGVIETLVNTGHVKMLDDLRTETRALAAQIATKHPFALRQAKRAVNQTLDVQGFYAAIQSVFDIHQTGHGNALSVSGYPILMRLDELKQKIQ